MKAQIEIEQDPPQNFVITGKEHMCSKVSRLLGGDYAMTQPNTVAVALSILAQNVTVHPRGKKSFW